MVRNIQEILALSLKRLRAARSWNQERLAEASGLSVATIQSIESRRAWVGIDSIAALSNALGVSEGELFRDPTLAPAPTIKEALAVIHEALGVDYSPVKRRRKTDEEEA